MQSMISYEYLQETICKIKIFENWTQPRCEARCAQRAECKREHSSITLQFWGAPFAKTLSSGGISEEYQENIRGNGAGREFEMRSAHKDFCNLGGTNRRLDLG